MYVYLFRMQKGLRAGYRARPVFPYINVYTRYRARSILRIWMRGNGRHKLFFNEMESLSISSVEIENCLQDRKENRCEMFFIFFFLSFFSHRARYDYALNTRRKVVKNRNFVQFFYQGIRSLNRWKEDPSALILDFVMGNN